MNNFIIINYIIFNKNIIRNIHVERIMDSSYRIVVETDDQDYYLETYMSEEYANETIKKIFAQLNQINIADDFKIQEEKEND